MGFLLRYLTTAIIGTLLIYYGAPRLKSGLSAAAPSRDGGAPVSYSTARQGVMPPAAEPRLPPLAAAEPKVQPPAAANQPAAEDLPATAAGQPVETAPQAAPAVASASQEPPPEVIVVTELGYTPSTQRIRASGTDITHWGVTLLQAPFFEKDGKRREETLPGGTLVEQVGITSSSKGEMALCRIWRGSGWSGPFLIATADLIRFPGGRDQVDADELDLLLRYAGLNARVEERKKELARRSVDANPHAAPLRQLKEKYDAAKAEAERLTRARDAAKGAERIRLGDELRRVKEREPRMRREIETVTRQYEAWKANLATPAADPAKDREIQAIQSQMEALRPRLGNFGL